MDETEFNARYTKDDLRRLTEGIKDKPLALTEFYVIDGVAQWLYTRRHSEANKKLNIKMFHHDCDLFADDVALSESEKMRAQNDLNRINIKMEKTRTLTTIEGITQKIDACQLYFNAPYEDQLVPALKPCYGCVTYNECAKLYEVVFPNCGPSDTFNMQYKLVDAETWTDIQQGVPSRGISAYLMNPGTYHFRNRIVHSGPGFGQARFGPWSEISAPLHI